MYDCDHVRVRVGHLMICDTNNQGFQVVTDDKIVKNILQRLYKKMKKKKFKTWKMIDKCNECHDEAVQDSKTALK